MTVELLQDLYEGNIPVGCHDFDLPREADEVREG